MSEMVERVAKEIYLHVNAETAGRPLAEVADAYLACARAAIAAMREPTEAMIKEATDTAIMEGTYGIAGEDAVSIWKAMIDAAISPSTSGTETKP